MSKEEDMDEEDYLTAYIITRTVCCIYLVDFIRLEYLQYKNSNLMSYLSKDLWNLYDILFIVIYAVYVPISFTSDKDDYEIKVLQCCIIMLFAIKLNFFLRIFDRFSFLVQMIRGVFHDVQNFILYFCIMIALFSILPSILIRGVQIHEGIGPI